MKDRWMTRTFLFLAMLGVASCAPTRRPYSYDEYEAPRQSNSSAQDHVKIGAAQAGLGYYNNARMELRQALANSPGNPAAHYELGRLDAMTGNMESARGHFLRVLETYPNCAATHANIGWVLIYLGRMKEARHHFHRAVDLNDELGSAYAGLGAIHLASGQEGSARNELRKSLNADAANPFANFYMGVLYQGSYQPLPTQGLTHAARIGFRGYSRIAWDSRHKNDRDWNRRTLNMMHRRGASER